MNQQAVCHNAKVLNNYGPKKFEVLHICGTISHWMANNIDHLTLLIRIEINLGYYNSVKSIQNK